MVEWQLVVLLVAGASLLLGLGVWTLDAVRARRDPKAPRRTWFLGWLLALAFLWPVSTVAYLFDRPRRRRPRARRVVLPKYSGM